jgi:hypothetical protein
MRKYEKPEIRDYGSLRELTASADYTGEEDGGGKLVAPHHT